MYTYIRTYVCTYGVCYVCMYLHIVHLYLTCTVQHLHLYICTYIQYMSHRKAHPEAKLPTLRPPRHTRPVECVRPAIPLPVCSCSASGLQYTTEGKAVKQGHTIDCLYTHTHMHTHAFNTHSPIVLEVHLLYLRFGVCNNNTLVSFKHNGFLIQSVIPPRNKWQYRKGLSYWTHAAHEHTQLHAMQDIGI